MSLLSKTLQTFLYKYLSDVDVEGVALPSLYDGASSGWGVRLCNVKLREGVQLMEELPGKIKKKRKKKKTKQKPSTSSSSSSSSSSSLSESKKQGSTQATTKSSQVPPSIVTDDDQVDAKVYEEVNKVLDRSINVETGKTMDTDYNDDDDDDASLELREIQMKSPNNADDGDSTSSRPSTPIQNSKSILSCFYKGSKKSSSSTNRTGMSDASLHRNSSSKETGLERQPQRIVKTMNQHENKDSEPEWVSESLKSDTSNVDRQGDNEEEYEEYDQPMKLVLGEEGRIGTLDVR